MVLEIVGEAALGFEFFQQLGMRDVAGDDQRPGQRQPCFHGILAQRRQNVGHRLVQVDGDGRNFVRAVDFRKELRRIAFQLFNENAFGRDFCQRLPVGRT